MAALLSGHEVFISGFIDQGGEVDIGLKSATDSAFMPSDKVSKLSLHPWYLGRLAENRIQLRVQVWIASSGEK